MPAITQNKLTPLLTGAVLLIATYVLWGAFASGQPAAVKSGADMPAVPTAPGDEIKKDPGGLLGVGAMSAPPARVADADSPGETLKTVTASNNDLRLKVQQVIDENRELKQENTQLRNDQSDIVNKVTQRVLADSRLSATQSTPAPQVRQVGSPTLPAPDNSDEGNIGNLVSAATGGYDTMVKSLGTPGTPAAPGVPDTRGIPDGLGYNTDSSGNPGTPGYPGAGGRVRVLPVGYKEAKAGDGSATIVNAAGASPGQARTKQAANTSTNDMGADTRHAETQEKKAAKPFFTIPENATMTRATLMTALVGRVPVDGKINDPMQFKLLIGRENLAANGQKVPDAIAGMVVSGIAVGDMALSCSEGLVQSLTFVFHDGSIRTVSMKRDGATQGFGGGAGGTGSVGQAQAPSVSQANKLAWISDEYGNPCINGKFVTNAPAYLTDVVGLKTLSIAAQATALAQTTTSENAFGSSTSVTGNKGTYVMGQAAGAGVNEVSNWIMRRLNNSFDAVVTPAGGRIVVHFEQEISIDKLPDSRKLDYGNSQARQLSGRQFLD